MRCLWCDKAIIPEISWSNLFIFTNPKNVCESCEHDLEILSGRQCERCSRQSEEAVCPDCKWWDTHSATQDSLAFNYSVFSYNQKMQDILTKWKYRGDYCLGEIFRESFRHSFREKFSFLPKNTLVVPIPLSDERLRERGFNQAKMLAEFLPLKTEEILTRIHTEKQSKKTRKERLSTTNPFKVIKTIQKPVILVDDIYTTGTTLRHAASLLKEQGCPNVYAYTLIRG